MATACYEETPEEKQIRLAVEKSTADLMSKLNNIERKVEMFTKYLNLEQDKPFMGMVGAGIDFHLPTRIKVFLETEYLNAIILPDTCCTDEEFKLAQDRATYQTNFILEQMRRFIDVKFNSHNPPTRKEKK